MSGKRAQTGRDGDAELAMLSAFLDGELTQREEADLLDLLAQRPDLQDALDALAAGIAERTTSFADDADLDNADADALAARVLKDIDADAVPASVGAVLTLAQDVVDGAASPAVAARLHTLIDLDPHFADATAGFVAAADVARAAAASAEAAATAALARLPEHVMVKVERQERAWALATGALDGVLSDVDAAELVAFASADAAHLDDLEAHHSVRHVGEAFRAAADSPAFQAAAAKAGAAALQVIAAEAAQAAAKTATATTATAAKTAKTVARAEEGSLLTRLRGWFAAGPVGPLVAATAAMGMFVLLKKSDPPTTAQPDPGAFAALQQAFVEAAAPAVLADNRTLEGGDLAVIGDNSADVLAIDGTNSTVVFQTPESNITVIWVDGIDADDDKEQGT